MNQNIAIYVQHYLSPSMTFVYRQIELLKKDFNTFVYCSGKIENLDLFPEKKLYTKKRNFYSIKYSKIFNRLFKYQRTLSVNPKLSFLQKSFFIRSFNKNNISLIHAHFGPSALEIYPIAKQLSIPLVITFHGYDISTLLSYPKYVDNITKVLQYADAFIVANSMKKNLIELGSVNEKVTTVRCGIPINQFEYFERKLLKDKVSKKEKIVFVQISNFVEKKGHIYTLKAFAKFLKFYNNAELILAGNGYLQKRCVSLTKELKIEEHVSFVGHLVEKDVFKLMKRADVFLHHSVTSSIGDKEGVPTVIMEAMATGVPVISTFHSGIPELIDDKINGSLVEEKDIQQYFEKMKDVLLSGDKFRITAREKVSKHFNIVVETQKMSDKFNQIINNNSI